jgi:shikimate kinase
MIQKSNIILTGFMATGKTTIGKLLAQQLNWKFVDTDEMIVSQQGMSIENIFSQFGEETFRKLENEIARDLAKRQHLVISTGGKMMLDPLNAEILEENGKVFSLMATPEEILSRLDQDQINTRPLLKGPDPKAKIIQLLQEREKGYQRFQTVDTGSKTPAEVAENILSLLK